MKCERRPGHDEVIRALALGLLVGWVLLAPYPLGTFGSAGACATEAVAWQARAREGERWVEAQYRAAPNTFWLEAVSRATREVEQAKAARCVEVRP